MHRTNDYPSLALASRPTGYAIVISLAFAALAAAMSGCNRGPDREPTYHTSGQILLDGKPLPHALVVLHPQGPNQKPARASTDENGNFTLTTYTSGDGAAAGDFNVTVNYYRPVKRDGEVLPGPNVIPAKYSNPARTQLSVSIKEGQNDLPLVLKR